MSDAFTLTHSGTDELSLRLRGLPANVRDTLRTAIAAQAQMLVGVIQDEKLSGQVLNVRTGRLRDSVTYDLRADDTGITATITAPATSPAGVPYGLIQEQGYSGTVRAHVRTITQAFGRSIAPRQITAPAHPMTLPPRPFMGPALAENSPAITTALTAALAQALETAP